MAGYIDDNEDSPSDNYMELKNEDIDSIIIKNFEFICDNLKVYDLITGRHSFVGIIPKNQMVELRIKDPELQIKHAENFLLAFLKSRDKGKGKVLKDALRQPEHGIVREVFSSRVKDLDKDAHTNEGALLDLHITDIIDRIDCDENWLSQCRQLYLLTANDFEEIQATKNNHGSNRAVVRLIECVKRAKDGYTKFMELLWKMNLRTLVKEIDPDKYAKFKARYSESDCDEKSNHIEYSSNPGSRNLNCADPYKSGNYYLKSDVTMSMKANLPNNILTEEMNNLDGPVSSRTRSKTKAIGFQSPNNNTSCSVNEELSTMDMSPQMMNPKTVDKPAYVTSTKYNKSPVLPGAHNRGSSSEDEDYPSSKDKKFRQPKTFGFQSPNTIQIYISTTNGNCQQFQTEPFPAKKRQENNKPHGAMKEIQYNEGHEEAQSEQTFVKERIEEPKSRENVRAIQHKTDTKHSEQIESLKTTRERRQEKDLTKTKLTDHQHIEKFQPAQSPQEKRKGNVQSQIGNARPRQLESTALKNVKDIPEDLKTTQLKYGEEFPENVTSAQNTVKGGKNSRNAREGSENVIVLSENARQPYEEIPKTFRCPQCSAAFRTDEKRQHHKCSSAHSLPPLSIKPLRCRCGKAFKDNETLTKHLATCDSGKSRAVSEHCDLGKSPTPSERSESRPQIFKCDKCGSKFLDKEKLGNHKRTQH